MVCGTESVLKAGLYNPCTMSKYIIVDGVVVSAHSSKVLDQWMPKQFAKYLPKWRWLCQHHRARAA